MLTPLTASCIDHGLAALRACQLLESDDGEAIPLPGHVSHQTIADFCGVSEGTIIALERLALAKVARALREDGLPPHLARAVCRLIDDPQQPELF